MTDRWQPCRRDQRCPTNSTWRSMSTAWQQWHPLWHASQLAVAQVHHRAILFKHISAWMRHAGICPMKHLCPVFTAGLTSMLPLIRSVTSHAWFLQAQDIEHCIRPIKLQYPIAADLLRQLLYLDPLQRPSAAQALQHTWFCQT